jgi:hypothetical protein
MITPTFVWRLRGRSLPAYVGTARLGQHTGSKRFKSACSAMRELVASA